MSILLNSDGHRWGQENRMIRGSASISRGKQPFDCAEKGLKGC